MVNTSFFDTYLEYLMTPCGLDARGEPRLPASERYTKELIRINDWLRPGAQFCSDLVSQCLREGKRKVFFWSDQHFGHKNSIRFCNRPFESCEHMSKVMIENLHSTVSAEDVVIWGGDVSFLSDTVTKTLLRDLPGTNLLVVGNHDLGRKKKVLRGYATCFDLVTAGFGFQYEGQTYYVSHYPIASILEPYNIHGHIHDKLMDASNFINMSVEHTNYRPVELKELLC